MSDNESYRPLSPIAPFNNNLNTQKILTMITWTCLFDFLLQSGLSDEKGFLMPSNARDIVILSRYQGSDFGV